MAEKEYIERDAVLEDIDSAMTNKGLGYVVGQFMKLYIKRQPAADVVEVVRCRDCKYGETSTCPITGVELFICRHGHLNRAVEKDHFCSYGERRERG